MDDEFSFGNVWSDSSFPKALPAMLINGPSKPPAPAAALSAATAFDDDDLIVFGKNRAPSLGNAENEPLSSNGVDDKWQRSRLFYLDGTPH